MRNIHPWRERILELGHVFDVAAPASVWSELIQFYILSLALIVPQREDTNLLAMNYS